MKYILKNNDDHNTKKPLNYSLKMFLFENILK